MLTRIIDEHLRIASTRESMVGARYGSVVGLTPLELEQARGSRWYAHNRLTATQPSEQHWRRPEVVERLPDYHPAPIDEFLAEMEKQQREDVQAVYDQQKIELKDYFSTN